MGERAGSGGVWRESPAAAPPVQPPDPRAAPGGQRRDAGGTPPGQAQDAGQNGQPDGPGDVTGDETAIPDLLDRIAELEDLRRRALADLDNLRKRCAARSPGRRRRPGPRWPGNGCLSSTTWSARWRHSTADPAAIIDGIRAVREQALNVLARLGYPRRDDLGTTFDPTRHDAVAARADPAAADGSVVEVLQPGYGEGDHQLRPAQVVVARPG